jgi:hypothetical protein
MIKLLVSFFFFLVTNLAKAQDISSKNYMFENCPSQTIFRTDSLGSRKEKLRFALTFFFKSDSLIVGNSLNLRREFMSFKIEKKESCKWNEDFSIGKTSFQLILTDKMNAVKRPKLNIIYEPSGKKYIELLYENSEERIFTIASKQ